MSASRWWPTWSLGSTDACELASNTGPEGSCRRPAIAHHRPGYASYAHPQPGVNGCRETRHSGRQHALGASRFPAKVERMDRTTHMTGCACRSTAARASQWHRRPGRCATLPAAHRSRAGGRSGDPPNRSNRQRQCDRAQGARVRCSGARAGSRKTALLGSHSQSRGIGDAHVAGRPQRVPCRRVEGQPRGGHESGVPQ